MAGKIAVEKGYIAIHNSTEIFRYYYQGILEKVFDNESKIIVVFIISLLGPLDYKSNKIAIRMLDRYNISDNDFYLICHQLNEKEVVDLYMDQAVKICDQSMGNYLLYHVLIEKRYITIAELLKKGFRTNKNKIIYALNTIISLFYSEDSYNYIKDQVNEIWNTIEDDTEQFEYIKSFHAFNEEKSLAYFKKKIDNMETEDANILKFEFENKMNNHTFKSEYIEVLGQFKDSDNYEVVLELLMFYFRKKPSEVMDLYFIFTDRLGYDKFSYDTGYKREIANIQKLWKESQEGKEINSTILMMYVIKNYIKYEHHVTESSGGRSINIITLNLHMCEGLDKLRSTIWGILGKLYVNETYVDVINKILFNFNVYQQYRIDSRLIFQIDLAYIQKYIFKGISYPSFTQSKIFKHFEFLCMIMEIEIDEELKRYQLNESFSIYNKLILNRGLGKDWSEEEELRRYNINQMVKDYDEQNFVELFSMCRNILENSDKNNEWSLQTGISLVFDSIKDNPKQYIAAVKSYLFCDTPFCYRTIDKLSVLIENVGIEETEKVIMSYDYNKKNKWIYDFICCIPETLVSIHHVELLHRIFDEEIVMDYPIIPTICRLSSKIDPFLRLNLTPYGLNFNQFKKITL